MTLALATNEAHEWPQWLVTHSTYTQHQVLCVTSHSLLASGKPCGNARVGLAGSAGFERFVTQMSHFHVYLALLFLRSR